MSLYFVRADLHEENHDLIVKATDVAMAVELWKRHYCSALTDRLFLKGKKIGVYLLTYHPRDMNTVIDWCSMEYVTIVCDGK